MKSVKKYYLKSWVKTTLKVIAIISILGIAYRGLVVMEEDRKEAIDYCVNEVGLNYEYCQSRI
jgi:hypothetical protein